MDMFKKRNIRKYSPASKQADIFNIYMDETQRPEIDSPYYITQGVKFRTVLLQTGAPNE